MSDADKTFPHQAKIEAVIDAKIETGGGGSAGGPVIRKFPFTFDTPGLLTGHAVYTPTIGDILIDAWIEVDTSWNGTTPFADFGNFVDDDNLGLFADFYDNGIELSGMADILDRGTIKRDGIGTRRSLSELSASADLGGFRVVPSVIVSAESIKICVSQNGRNNGADPGSTQGEAVLYLVTATPV